MKVSVALCTYNGASHIALQLESILLQTIPVFEIVICDDGSTDDTIAIIENWQNKYPETIQLHVNKTNLGAKKNFEQAIARCAGDYIFLSDQDDEWLPHKVAATLPYFESNSDATVIFSDGNLINHEGEVLPYSIWDSIGFSERLRSDINPKQLFEFLIINDNVVTGAAMCFRKEARSYLFPFFCPDRYWHDYWIAIAAAYKNQLIFIKDKLINYRLHSNQQASLPKMNEFYKQRNSIKEMIWLQQYDNAFTKKLFNHYFGSKKRFELFAPSISRLEQDTERLGKLNTFIVDEMELLKKKLFLQMGFFNRKKMFLIWLLGRQKTYTITRFEIIKLMLT